MTLKRNIRILQAIVCLTLLIVGALQTWKCLLVFSRTEEIGAEVAVLGKLQRVRTLLHDQEQKLVLAQYWGLHPQRDVFQMQRRVIGRLAEELEANIAGSAHEGGDRALPGLLAALTAELDVFNAHAERYFSQLTNDRTTLARAVREEEIEPLLRDRVYPHLNQLLDLQTADIQLAYHETIAHANSATWLSLSVLDDIALASQAIDYARRVEETSSFLEAQLRELLEFLDSGNPADLDDYRFFAGGVREQIPKIEWTIARQERQGMTGEEEDREHLAVLKERLVAGELLFTETINHRSRIVDAQVLDAKAREALAFGNDHLFPLLLELAKDAREEVAETHRHLLATTARAAVAWVVGLLAVMLLLMTISIRVGNRALGSLAVLGEGARRIRGGDLDNRITLAGADEFRELADEFNAMAGVIKETQGELERFVYITSHDLRAPLISLQGFSGELRKDIEQLATLLQPGLEQLPADVRDAVQHLLRGNIPDDLRFIESAAERMGRQVNALLKLCREGSRELKPVPINLGEVLDPVLASLAHQIASNQVAVTVAPLPEVLADPLCVEQILGNLLDNALKYLDPSRPGEIRIDAAHGEIEAVVRIRDNGRGIAANNRERIFEVFQRVDHPDIPGEGMGLSYVRALVRRSGGKIWCESEEGAGSTFCFTLPLAGPAPPKPVG